jgi:hypothetical protein
MIEQPSQAPRALSEIAADQTVVACDDEGHRQRGSESLGDGRFAVAGRPSHENAVPRLETPRPEQLAAEMLFDDFPTDTGHTIGKYEILETPRRRRFDAEIVDIRVFGRWAEVIVRDAVCIQLVRQTIGQNSVLLGALIGDKRIHRVAERPRVAGFSGFHQRNE